MFTSFLRIIKFAFQNFFRNIWLSLATISVIMLTLLSVSFLGFLNVLTREAVESIKERVDVSVYFKPEVTPQEVKAVKEKLSSLDKIKNITFISREDSLKFLQEKHKNEILVQESLAELGANPLGDTLVIQAAELNYYPLILEALEQSQYKGLIEDRNYEDNQIFLKKIYAVTDKIKMIGFVISIVFAAISVLIVFNTVRIAIYSHSEEISIMKLVGADNWFIRAPFLVETLIYAVVGTITTILVLIPIIQFADPYILDFFDNSFSLFAYYMSHIAYFSLWHFVGTLVLTVIASFIAVGRYLDV